MTDFRHNLTLNKRMNRSGQRSDQGRRALQFPDPDNSLLRWHPSYSQRDDTGIFHDRTDPSAKHFDQFSLVIIHALTKPGDGEEVHTQLFDKSRLSIRLWDPTKHWCSGEVQPTVTGCCPDRCVRRGLRWWERHDAATFTGDYP